MLHLQRRAPHLVLTALLAAGLPACAPVGDILMGDVGGYPSSGRTSIVSGEVRSVDSRRGQLQVRDDRNSRNVNLRYDNRTRVSSGQRQYPASSLRRGDWVRVNVSYDRSGNAWADRVEVRGNSAGRNAGRVQRIDGTVRSVDVRRGYFAVDQGRSSTVVVYVPQRLGSSDARRFERLRRGERVRADVRLSGGNTAELVRFR